jgi:hypothetical protein
VQTSASAPIFNDQNTATNHVTQYPHADTGGGILSQTSEKPNKNNTIQKTNIRLK